jgi:hypothetical protein
MKKKDSFDRRDIELAQLMARRGTLIAYLASCVAVNDWHGVRDAAVDIEVVTARIESIQNFPSN